MHGYKNRGLRIFTQLNWDRLDMVIGNFQLTSDLTSADVPQENCDQRISGE